MNINRYLTLVTLFTVTLLSGIASFNYFINPYLIFDVPRIEGLNSIKADINSHVRMAKTYHPLNKIITTLLVGNSRIEMGINPNNKCFSPNTYNLGIPGASIETQVAYALNILRQKAETKQIIMSIDFVDFLSEKGRPVRTNLGYGGQNSLRYFIDGEKNQNYWIHQLKDKYKALLTLDATSSSLKTIMLQQSSSANRTQQGFNPAKELARATEIEGPYRVFEHTVNMLERTLYNKSYPEAFFSENVNYIALQEVVDYAKANSIELIFYISPLHDSFYKIIKDAELNEDLDRWKNDVNRFMTTNKLSDHFYDFSILSGKTDEAYPLKHQKAPLSWFWEPAHFNQTLGDSIIESMLREHCAIIE